jgi:hypothetical protein
MPLEKRRSDRFPIRYSTGAIQNSATIRPGFYVRKTGSQLSGKNFNVTATGTTFLLTGKHRRPRLDHR